MLDPKSTLEAQQMVAMLTEYWPSHAALAGDAVVRRTAEAVLSGEHPRKNASELDDSGAPFDLKTTVEIVGEALTFLKLCLDVYKLLKEQSACNVTSETMIQKLLTSTKRAATIGLIGSKRGRKAIDAVCKT
jgi:hypothetical protein